MKSIYTLTLILLVSPIKCLLNKVEDRETELDMDFLDQVRYHGYPMLTYTVLTKDGYKISVNRIPGPTGEEIQDSLENLIKNRTTIIIAHRLSTVMKADYIIVLEKGGVAQLGTHDQLLEKGGLYQKLWQLQAGGYIE